MEDALYVASALESYAYEYSQNIDSPYFLRSRKIVIDYLLRQLSRLKSPRYKLWNGNRHCGDCKAWTPCEGG